jgi:hypothetical protein
MPQTPGSASWSDAGPGPGMRRNPWRKAASGADRRQPSFPSKRPVTPEVAGSSPVAPVKSRAKRHVALPAEAVKLRRWKPSPAQTTSKRPIFPSTMRFVAGTNQHAHGNGSLKLDATSCNDLRLLESVVPGSRERNDLGRDQDQGSGPTVCGGNSRSAATAAAPRDENSAVS